MITHQATVCITLYNALSTKARLNFNLNIPIMHYHAQRKLFSLVIEKIPTLPSCNHIYFIRGISIYYVYVHTISDINR